MAADSVLGRLVAEHLGVRSPQVHTYGLTDMDEGYDIFRREIDGKFVWVGARETFARARAAVVQDPASFDREFMIVNALTGERTLIKPPRQTRSEGQRGRHEGH